MSSVEIISVQIFKVKKTFLEEFPARFSIDTGCSLTKIIFAPKTITDDYKKLIKEPLDESSEVLFVCKTYNNKYYIAAIEECLQEVQHSTVKDDKPIIKLTGVYNETLSEAIKYWGNYKFEMVHEFVGQLSGTRFLIDNYPQSEFCYPEITRETMMRFNTDADSKFMELVRKQIKNFQIPDERKNDKYPVVLCVCGSGFAIYLVDKTGNSKILGLAPLGGKTFLGLSAALTGITDYNTITEMASRGNRRNTDTQFKDVNNLEDDSAYKGFTKDPDMPIFAFGKAVDKDLGVEAFQKEDILNSLLNFICRALVTHLLLFLKETKAVGLYLSGNFLKSEHARETIHDYVIQGTFKQIVPKFIDNGNVGAIGSLFCNVDEEMKL